MARTLAEAAAAVLYSCHVSYLLFFVQSIRAHTYMRMRQTATDGPLPLSPESTGAFRELSRALAAKMQQAQEQAQQHTASGTTMIRTKYHLVPSSAAVAHARLSRWLPGPWRRFEGVRRTEPAGACHAAPGLLWALS